MGCQVVACGFSNQINTPIGFGWIVFVPNGFVIHDYLATRSPSYFVAKTYLLLVRQRDIDTSSEDLIDVSQLALGLCSMSFSEAAVVPRSRGIGEVSKSLRFCFPQLDQGPYSKGHINESCCVDL